MSIILLDRQTGCPWLHKEWFKVANWVQEIRDGTDPSQWHYVPSVQNSADTASRGLTPQELKDSMWLTGSPFLWESGINLIDAIAQILTFKIWLTFLPCDIINDVMSAWNVTCTTRHPIQCTCKILFVWHQSFIVKLFGQKSWQT